MALNVPLLRKSFDLVVERQPQITPRFYEILFERYPAARPLFSRNAPERQQQMLQEALVAVVENLENAPWLSQTLGAIGRKHLDYGVTDEMYDWVGDALLRTLGEIAGDAWTPELKAAWAEAYGALVTMALAGANEARREATTIPPGP
ncbi:MAG TPA: globin domain-containing protein [Polyangiaceae bacterium]|nr:globin domain-containing protein [Polyangiaceae bacterium]